MNIKSTHVLSIVFAAIILSACKKEGDGCEQSAVTQANIQGTWKHDYPKNQDADFSHPDQYDNLRLTPDSFFLQVTHRSDMLFANGCNQVLWTEYAKGGYAVNGNVLALKGVFTESDYSVKTGGCYSIGAYADSFRVSYCNDALKMYWLSNYNLSDEYRNITMAKHK